MSDEWSLELVDRWPSRKLTVTLTGSKSQISKGSAIVSGTLEDDWDLEGQVSVSEVRFHLVNLNQFRGEPVEKEGSKFTGRSSVELGQWSLNIDCLQKPAFFIKKFDIGEINSTLQMRSNPSVDALVEDLKSYSTYGGQKSLMFPERADFSKPQQVLFEEFIRLWELSARSDETNSEKSELQNARIDYLWSLWAKSTRLRYNRALKQSSESENGQEEHTIQLLDSSPGR